ncbi:hypothetical protein Acsp06_36140 [Actinomycetospora sp. NBRC 106375]|uniref:adenosylcobinamide-GDP ribazoletransferase n=1 Tax=Actinomycetospora sp. NBRC 106375 TaxID=3032207 RepID=UPI0024A0E991|nr:adenosylcobinamide-GDP ribazoletransferase [Actinomycetospora sp. NBRC 106375]GLZ47429.1 hypothetical protein Acsp06_36140 [Actinomycetospora sp. NBRC 106375]
MAAVRAGVALAVAMFTVVPLRATRVDRPAAGVAIAVVPLVGVVLGGVLGAAAAGLVAAGAPELLAGLVAVGLGAAATRGLHLDGLADLADGLGSHGDAARTLAVMRDPGTGAFAVVWLVVVLGVQASAFGALAGQGVLVAAVAGGLALGLGRAAFAWVARRGVPAASPDGLGALVAGTQPVWVAPAWAVVLAAAAVPVLDVRAPGAALLAAVVVAGVAAHARRRLGGVSGDVFGACAELAVTAALVVSTLG